MTRIVKADVLAMAPELSTTTDMAWADILDYANDQSADELGVAEDHITLRMARLYLAAHFAAVAKRARTGAAGPVVSEAAGSLRRSYGLVSSSVGDIGFGLTQYGQMYLTLLRGTLAHTPFLV